MVPDALSIFRHSYPFPSFVKCVVTLLPRDEIVPRAHQPFIRLNAGWCKPYSRLPMLTNAPEYAEDRPQNLRRRDADRHDGCGTGLACHLAGEVGPAGVADQRRRAGVPEDVNLRAKALAKPAAIADLAFDLPPALHCWVRSVPPARRSRQHVPCCLPRIRVTLSTTSRGC
ncbi:hypothetical protein BANRA_00003 [Klebsiella pneumoniae]|nr:hypothetical protein BANRA_00003 [Klebsiella pneumoniae]